jgi:MFS family permease
VLYLIYFARLVPEIELKELEPARKARRPPLAELIRGPQAWPLAQVVMLMTGMWFASQMTVSFQPVILITVLHQAPGQVSDFEIVSGLVTGIGMVLYGVLSQRLGRRVMLRWVAVSVVGIGSVAWLLMVHFANSGSSFVAIAAMAALAAFVTNAPLGVFVVYLNERFGTRVRAAGYSTAYTFGLILPGLYTVWVKGLAHIVPFAYTALFLIPLGGLLVLIAAQLGPETRDVDLLVHEPSALEPEPEAEPAAARVGAPRRERGVATPS